MSIIKRVRIGRSSSQGRSQASLARSWRAPRGWDWTQGTERRAVTRSRTTEDCTAEVARRGIATMMSRSSTGAWRTRMALSPRSSWRVSSAEAWALWAVGSP